MASITPPGTVSEQKYQRLVSKYHELRKRYERLEQRHAKCDRYMEQAYEKYKAAKNCAQQWKAYVDKRRAALNGEANLLTPTENLVMEKDRPERVTSSQTTDGEQEACPLATGQPGGESDEVEVVSTRQVRRKRSNSTRAMPPPVRIKRETTSLVTPIDLVSGDYSSPESKRRKPVRAETSDLDALGEHMDTPRKRKRQRPMSEEPARPAPLLLATSSPSEGDLLENAQIHLQFETEPGAGVPHHVPAVTARDFAAHIPPHSEKSNALNSLSVNVPRMPRHAVAQLGRNRKRKHERAQGKYTFLSEDGEDQTSQVVAPQHEETPKSDASRRLDTLLEQPSPDRQPLPKRSTPQPSSSRPREVQAAAKEPQMYTANTSAPRQPVAFKVPRGLENPPPPVLPEEEPLRCRPVGSLCLDDFKINPRYLGVDYAFADTFRGREQRRCLQGCTKPECCGDAFRKAVEIGAVRSDKPDAQVLEQFLGPNYDIVMGAYPPDRRKELLVQAHAYAYANQHGKHRQAFERRSTPPGFWRTDMPTTQEQEDDRTRAHEMERQKVEERWREAMREDGRWLFRDE